jgi:hypothetical protein
MTEVRQTKAKRCRDLVLELDAKYGGTLKPKDMVFKIMSELDLSHVTATNYLYNARRAIDISRGAPIPGWMLKKKKKSANKTQPEKVPELEAV